VICLPFPDELCEYERCRFYNCETGNCEYKGDPPVTDKSQLLKMSYKAEPGDIAFLLETPLEKAPSWIKMLPQKLQYIKRLWKFERLDELIEEYLKITIR